MNEKLEPIKYLDSNLIPSPICEAIFWLIIRPRPTPEALSFLLSSLFTLPKAFSNLA